MGIRGLTTFINNRSHLYLQDYQLHDCNVVIDGNSLASNLYKWHCKSNDCFGGDYDKLANVTRNFFDVLSQCNITPYVILDGGYEKRKLNTVATRMKNKIRAAEALNAVTEGSESVFPLFLREVFVDIIVSLGIKLARCDFEGDMEIAGIAQSLECPVISYDSDFFVFGCLYIPFSTVEITVRKGKNKPEKTTYSYLACKIYHIEHFLEAFGGLDKNNLPVLSVLLGNDYVKGSLFRPFFRNLKIQKCSGNQSDQQKRIKSVIVWLQNETVESAIKTVLSRFKDGRRKVVLKKIQGAMKGYFEINSELLKYLDIEPIKSQTGVPLDFNKLKNQDDVCTNEESDSDVEDESDTETNTLQNNSESDDKMLEDTDSELEEDNKISKIFSKNYRKCQYPACLMDMITLNRYYCIPQVEDSSSVHSHTISLDILNIIYKILTPNSERGLKTVCRSGKGHIRYTTLPRLEISVPTLEDIENFNVQTRKLLLLNLLAIDNKLIDTLDLFPTEWHLFLVSLGYAIKKGNFDKSIIHSCLMCFVILNYIDPKVGFHRVTKTFDKKFSLALTKITTEDIKSNFNSFDTLSFDECLVFMNKMIAFFQMDLKLKTNYRLYDKTLVHTLSQIQSVFLHVKYLNSVLNLPFPILEIHKLFDGTFIYNMTVNLRKRPIINEYLDLFLKDCPSVLGGMIHVLNRLDVCLNVANAIHQPVRKRKKRKKKIENCAGEVENMVQDEEIGAILDPNNPYSILAVL